MKLIEEDEGLNYQMAAPGDHWLMPAEQAIRTFKNHFITIYSGTDPGFPEQAWHHILEQAVTTLNILRPYKLNPMISAYMQVHGVFGFNCTPLAPARCKIIIHNWTNERPVCHWQSMDLEDFILAQHYIIIKTMYVIW